MPARDEITPSKLRRLAEMQAAGPVVVSLYLDLDPERFAVAGARQTAVRSLIDSGARQIEATELEHEQREQLRADLGRVEQELEGGVPEGAHGLAIFCCASLELFETLSLPVPVESSISFDSKPHVAPLAALGPAAHWCVALVNRRAARILRGSQNQLFKVAELEDSVQGSRSRGGGFEHASEAHLRHVADVLLSQQRRRPFAGLVVGAPHELRSIFEGLLHPYVRERLAGYLEDVDIESASEEQIRASAAEVIAEHDRRRVAERLERLRSELGRDERAVGGTEGVLRALEERRVEALLFTTGQGTDELLEDAVEAAIAQDAEVVRRRRPRPRTAGRDRGNPALSRDPHSRDGGTARMRSI